MFYLEICIYFYLCVCACDYRFVCVYHRGTVASEARRGAESSGAGVIGGCEQPNVVTENSTCSLEDQCLLLGTESSV